MKLQRQKAVVTEGMTYYRHVITIPSKIIDALGWDPGQDLTPKVVDIHDAHNKIVGNMLVIQRDDGKDKKKAKGASK